MKREVPVFVALFILLSGIPLFAQTPHSADTNNDWKISHEELLQVIELWRAGEYHIDDSGTYKPGPSNTPEPLETITVPIPGDMPPSLNSWVKQLEMVRIPAGTFWMGSPAEEKGHRSDERQHKVTITQDYCIGKYEVTYAQWGYVMDGGISGLPSEERMNVAVTEVTWQECQEFIEKLNQMGLGTFRLPTEAEWEYACRAGTTTRFYWGDDPDLDQYGDYVDFNQKEVGTKLPNDWGLYGMSTCVAEWCADWYGEYSWDAQTDPTGPSSGTSRVVRGGDPWNSEPTFHRSAMRNHHNPENTDNRRGLRLVREYP